MGKQPGFNSGRGVLDPSLPLDIGAVSQRQRIAEAMIDLCAEKTFAGTTIADIVSKAAISRTTFYKHFDDKRACFDAALETCVEELSAAAMAADIPTDSPAMTIREAATAILELLAERPALAQITLGEAIALDVANADRLRGLLIPALERCWLLAGEKPRGRSDPSLAFGRVQVLVLDQIVTGRAERLPDLLPEIIYIATLPFAGHEEALSQAKLIAVGEISERARDASAR
jgi:AcrR family transcriptional regulator